MPIYEYICSRCGEMNEFLERAGETAKHSCSACGSKRLSKTFSTFAARSKSSPGTSSARGSSSCASCRAASCVGCRR